MEFVDEVEVAVEEDVRDVVDEPLDEFKAVCDVEVKLVVESELELLLDEDVEIEEVDVEPRLVTGVVVVVDDLVAKRTYAEDTISTMMITTATTATVRLIPFSNFLMRA